MRKCSSLDRDKLREEKGLIYRGEGVRGACKSQLFVVTSNALL